MAKFHVVLLLIVTQLVSKFGRGQVLQFGVCPEVQTMRYFNLDKFLGKWYEIERYPTWYEDFGHCAFKFINACGRIIEIEHGFVRDEIQYILHLNSTYSPGDDAVFEVNKSNIDPIGIPLQVIETDYNDYAVLYGCKNSSFLEVRYVSAWILARERALPEDILTQAREVLNSVSNAYVAYLEPVSQEEEHCQYHWTAHVDAEEKEIDEEDLELVVKGIQGVFSEKKKSKESD